MKLCNRIVPVLTHDILLIMPLKSEAQALYLEDHHPDVYSEFKSKTPKGTKLPRHVEKAQFPKKKLGAAALYSK